MFRWVLARSSGSGSGLHATTLLREGVPVHIVAKRLGHKDASVTLNVYADAIPDDDTRAMDVFSRAIWEA